MHSHAPAEHRAYVNARDPEILRGKLDAVRVLWRGSELGMDRSDTRIVTPRSAGQPHRLPPVGSGLYGLPYERLRPGQSPRDIAEGPVGKRDFFWICSDDIARIEGAEFEIVPGTGETAVYNRFPNFDERNRTGSKLRVTKRGTVVGANIGWFGDVNEVEKLLIQEYVTRWYIADLVPRHAFEWQYVVESPKDPS
jgi:hypothetical protein